MTSERGFSLMEAIVATVIAIIAILGLAYSFGQGRAMIGRFDTARSALAAAQGEMDLLAATLPNDSTLAIGPGNSTGLHARDFVLAGQVVGAIRWSVTPVDDPADGVGAADPNPFDLKQVVVTVLWTTGFNPGSVSLTRFFPAQ